MTRQRFIASAAAVVILLFPVAAAHASSYTGTLTIDCTGFSDVAPNTVTFDRDNTGTGSEAYEYLATDGAGTTLFTFNGTLPLGSYTLGTATYTTPPAYNPITVTLTSLAGTGLPAQTIFTIQGTCAGLPTGGIPALSTWGLIALASLLGVVAMVVLRRRFL